MSFVNGALTISAAPITAITGNLTGTVSKTYDGTTAATLAPSNYVLAGWVGSDSANVTKTSGTFDNANAGSAKTVTVSLTNSDYAAAGSTNLSNYSLPSTVSGAVGTINKANLSVTANNAAKTYDAIAYSGGNGVAYSGFVNSETSSVLGGTLSYSGTSQGALNVGSYAITPGGLTSSNYNVSFVNGALTISAAPITAITGNLTGTVSKTYDGTTAATLAPSNYVLAGWVGSDSASVTKTSGTFDNANAGSGKTVTVSLTNSDYAAVGSTNLSNYSLPASVAGAVGSISKANATVTANSNTVTYNGVAQSVTGFTASGLVNGETIAVLGGVSTMGGSGTNAGSYTHTASGTDENYNLSFTAGSLKIIAASPIVIPPVVGSPSTPGVVNPITPITPVSTNTDTSAVGSPNPLPNVNPGNVIPPAGNGERGGSGSSGGASGELSAGGISISLNLAPLGNAADGVTGGVVTVTVPKAMATSGTGFSFDLPAQVRESLGTGAIQVTLADGSPLPGWIQFNPVTQRFEAGAVPDGGLPLQILLRSGKNQVLIPISERTE